MARKQYDDDDGRTIADMSGIGSPSPLGHLPFKKKQRPEAEGQDYRMEDPPFTREETRWYMLGALKAALLIGFAFIAGLALVTILLMLLWGVF